MTIEQVSPLLSKVPAALKLASKAYQKLGETRLTRLFVAARKGYDTEGKVDDETVWGIIEASLEGDKAEAIFLAAQRALLAASPTAISLMGLLIGRDIKDELSIGSSNSKLLRILMNIEDEDLHFLGKLMNAHFDLVEGKVQVPGAVSYPNNFTIIGPQTAITIVAGIIFDAASSEKILSLKRLQLGHPQDARDYLNPSNEAIEIGRLFRVFYG